MVSTIKFSQFTNAGDLSNSDITVGYGSGNNQQYTNPWTFLAPGLTADRPAPTPTIYNRLRFNTSLFVYEYYDSNTASWQELSGSGTGTINPGLQNNIAYYPFNGTAVSGLSNVNNSVLVTNSSGVPSLSTTLPVGLSIPGAIITSSTAALTSGQITAVPSASTDLVNKAYVDSTFSSGVTSIFGTSLQVNVSAHTGSVTLSLPQNIDTGASPTFFGMTLTDHLNAAGINLSGNTISTINTNANLNFITNGQGQYLFGSSTQWTAQSSFDMNLQLGANSRKGIIILMDYINDQNASSLIFSKSRSTIIGNFVPVQVNDTVGNLSWDADDGTNRLRTGQIRYEVDAAVSTGIIPSRCLFLTMNTSGILTEAMLIDSSQTVKMFNKLSMNSTQINNLANPSLAQDAATKNYVDSIVNVTSITGTANEIIASASTGAVTLSTPQSLATTAAFQLNTLQFNSNNGLLDSNGKEMLSFNPSGSSAVNYLTIYNNTTGNQPSLRAAGSDTDIGFNLYTKGAGSFNLVSAAATLPLTIFNGTGSQHTTAFSFSNTSAARTVTFPDASFTIAGTSLALSGTGAALTASNGGIIYSNASSMAVLSGTATAGQLLTSGASTTPAWTTSTYPLTNAVNTLLYASSANTMAALATANSSVLITSSGGVPSLSTTLPSGIAATNMSLTTPTLGAATATSINFGGNSLSNYVSSTSFTPIITIGGSSTGITYSTQVGEYMRIGSLVHFTISLALTSIGGLTGTVVVTGLPLTAGGYGGVACSLIVQNVTYATGIPIAYVGSSTTVIQPALQVTATTLTNMSNTNVGNTSIIQIAGSYLI